jgi:alpha-1,2-mannosyltransferase
MGNSAWQAVRSGSWLTQDRVRAACIVLLCGSVLLLAALHVTAHGVLDYQNRPLGTDFSQVWVAGKAVLAGEPAAPYDNALHWARQKAVFGPDAEFYGWLYPPLFLVPAALLALLPYWPALLAWTGLTLALYGAAIRAILPRPGVMLVALAFPAIFINAGHGNNGFLTAALLGGSLALLDTRPVAAGVLLGLLAYKPQFGVLIPLALLAGGHGRALLSASATVVLTVALTLVLFGWQPWLGFRDSLEFSRTVVLEGGGAGYHRLQSAFAALRLWGAPVGLAYAAQLAVASLAAWWVWRAWRGPCDPRIAKAVLALGTLLATPYLFDYDLVVLAVPGAFLAAVGAERGFRPWEASILALAWLAPLVSRNLAATIDLPIGLLAMLALFAALARRVVASRPRLLASPVHPGAANTGR